jgi:hypothetical protein
MRNFKCQSCGAVRTEDDNVLAVKCLECYSLKLIEQTKDTYRCELCKDDHPTDPPTMKGAIAGVDIRKHRTEGMKLVPPQDSSIHICGRCIDTIGRIA